MSKEKQVQIVLSDGTQITIPYRTISELIGKLGRFKGIETEVSTVPTEEGNLNYIKDEKIKQLCADCLKQLKKLAIELRPIKYYWFSGYYGKKRFMYLGCKQRFFVCYVIRPDGTWTDRIRISNKADWEKIFSNEVIPAYKNLGGTI